MSNLLAKKFQSKLPYLIIAKQKFHLSRSFSTTHDEPVDPDYEQGGKSFQEKWVNFFDDAYDLFEVQRGLSNCFSYDLVPPVPVLKAAMRAARRHNDYATAVRILGGLKGKTEDDWQYSTMVYYLRPIMKELGVETPEELGRYD